MGLLLSLSHLFREIRVNVEVQNQVQGGQTAEDLSNRTRDTELWDARPTNSEEASCCFSGSSSGLALEVGVRLCEAEAEAEAVASGLGDR